MKKITLSLKIIILFSAVVCILIVNQLNAQNTGINTTTPDNSAVLDLESTQSGLLIPRMTTAQRNAIDLTGNPQSVIIFNTDDLCFQTYVSSQWNNMWCFDCSPKITSNPSSSSICEGIDTSFSVLASGTNLTYQWQVSTDGGSSWNDITAAGSDPVYANWTSATLSVSSVIAANNSYQYHCVVSGSCSPNATSNAATLTVNTAPSISSHPSDESIMAGDNASFSVTATGAGLTYQWQESTDSGSSWSNITNGGSSPAYSGAISPNLDLTNVPSGYDGYDYQCVVSGTCTPSATSNSADLTVNPFNCGTSTVTFTYNGSSVTYGTVSGQNGTCWLDRNLGATRVATASDDSDAYGDLFQWGRLDDGHQIRTSGTTATLSNTNSPGHGDFITNGSNPYDWRSPQNDNLWQGVSGTNNPCPSGYRLPTEAEWEAERTSWGNNSSAGAFTSPLKLPVAGYRNFSSGSLTNVGSYGRYWSSTVDGTYSQGLHFYSSNAGMSSSYRAYGRSVRCIKD